MRTSLPAAVLLCAVTLAARADRIHNENFEKRFEVREEIVYWGEVGEVFGEVYQVNGGDAGHPSTAKAGSKFLVINIPEKSWNGLWQEVEGKPEQPYSWKANHMIMGDLPDTVATFLKVEFYDQHGELISAIEGEWLRNDTAGLWVESAMKGTTPAGTKKVRFVIIAGDNSEGAEVKNRIYWDNASAQ